jgi:hypothetical protein
MNTQQSRSSETATDRLLRREALLNYGHIFAEAHRSSQDEHSELVSVTSASRSRAAVQTENDA